MNKLKLTILSLLTVLTVTAADLVNVSLDGGYNNYYVVNGVAYATDTPYAGISAAKSLKYADVYVGGLLLANGSQDQSHWLVGVGKSVNLYKEIGIRLDGNVIRHQTDSSGIPNSTELGAKLALTNPWITPYVRGAFNIEQSQNAYFVGAERVQKLPLGFVFTPSVEWGQSTSYQSLIGKGSLTRPVTFAWGTVTPYAEVGWYNNGTFETAAKVYALERLNEAVVYSAGLKLSF